MNLEPIRAGLKSLRSLCDQYGQEPDGNSGDYDTGIQHGQNECAANIYKVLGEMETALSQSLAARDKEIESIAARLGLIAVALNRTEPEGAELIAVAARELALLKREAI